MAEQATGKRTSNGAAAWISILVPAALFVWFAGHVPAVAAGEVLVWRLDWVPSLGVGLGLLLDGLSLTFALLITGIGALVTLYASRYLDGHVHYTRFVCYLLSFMVGMLGLVLSDNLLALFVFWEVTTVASYLLIGFDAESAKARRSALQALMVTGAGALAFLAGIVLLGTAAGTYEISAIAEPLAGHPLYLAIFWLFVAGAFTKSAQVPFHFWLPNAMAAPTPVSAYLHSATMVKGGVYLLARMTPALGGTDVWFWTLVVAGGVTAVFASLLAVRQTDIKQVLAYTTLMALGTLVMFIGVGTGYAIEAAMAFLVVHSLYKAALFLMIGVVDHATGTRDATVLRGLGHAMPVTAAAALLAAASMAGLPPLLGFIGKEFMYKAALSAPATLWVLGCIFSASVLMFVAAGIVAWRPFTGRRAEAPDTAHEGPWRMLLGPVLLAGLGLVLGLKSDWAETLVRPAAAAVAGRAVEVDLYLFGGVTTAFLLSLATFAAGLVVYALHGRLRAGLSRFAPRFDPAWDRIMDGIAAGAKGLTGALQTGLLRRYVFVTFATLAAALSVALWRADLSPAWPPMAGLSFKHWAVLVFILAGALLTAFTNSRMTAVAALGVVGIGVALVFIIFGAPDVAITQLLVEVLQVVLVAVAMLKLPYLDRVRVRTVRGRDLTLALVLGAITTLVMLAVQQAPIDLELTRFYEAASVPLAHGRNIVNVILVDFRALDTFGEIAVVAVAALAAFALLKGGREARR